jgi:hypothetical protein
MCESCPMKGVGKLSPERKAECPEGGCAEDRRAISSTRPSPIVAARIRIHAGSCRARRATTESAVFRATRCRFRHRLNPPS